MPSSPARHSSQTPARRTGQSGDAPRTSSRPQVPSAPRRTQSYTPRSSPNPRASTRPATARRHTTQIQPQAQPRSNRPLPPLPAHASSPSPSHRRTNSSPAPARGGPHVLIPVPIRARDAESPAFIRAPSGQRVDFVFSPPKKRGLIGRLLDSVEWGDPQANKPYRYRKPTPKTPPSSRPFYKKLLP